MAAHHVEFIFCVGVPTALVCFESTADAGADIWKALQQLPASSSNSVRSALLNLVGCHLAKKVREPQQAGQGATGKAEIVLWHQCLWPRKWSSSPNMWNLLQRCNSTVVS